MADVKKEKTALDVMTPEPTLADIEQIENEMQFDPESPEGKVADTILGSTLKNYQDNKGSGTLDALSGFTSSPETVSKATSLFGVDLTKGNNKSILSALQGLVGGLGKKEDVPVLDEKEFFSQKQRLRDKFLPVRERAEVIEVSTKNLLSSLQKGTGAGDVTAVYSWMKALDPGGRVTDAEVRLAKALGTKKDKLELEVKNFFMSGEQMPPGVRIALADIVRDTYKAHTDIYNRRRKNAESNASKVRGMTGGDLEDVVGIEPSKVEFDAVMKVLEDKMTKDADEGADKPKKKKTKVQQSRNKKTLDAMTKALKKAVDDGDIEEQKRLQKGIKLFSEEGK